MPGRERWAKRLFLAGLAFMGLLVVSPFVWLWVTGLVRERDARSAAERILASDSPLVASVVVDAEEGLVVMLVPGAGDAEARDVWCDLVLPTGLDWLTAEVGSADPSGWWTAPEDCSDAFDYPRFAAGPV
jgi:hypothetical protein